MGTSRGDPGSPSTRCSPSSRYLDPPAGVCLETLLWGFCRIFSLGDVVSKLTYAHKRAGTLLMCTDHAPQRSSEKPGGWDFEKDASKRFSGSAAGRYYPCGGLLLRLNIQPSCGLSLPHQQDGTGAGGDAATLHIPRTDVDGQRARWAPPKLFLLELLRDAVFIWNKGGSCQN
ncbi:hypothetical protein H8959_004458 [Pygathrix nigripes]